MRRAKRKSAAPSGEPTRRHTLSIDSCGLSSESASTAGGPIRTTPFTDAGPRDAASSATAHKFDWPATTHGSPTSSSMYASVCAAQPAGVRGGSSQPPKGFIFGFGCESPIPTTSMQCSAGPGDAAAHASRKRPQKVRSIPTPIGGSSTTGGRAGFAAGTTAAE